MQKVVKGDLVELALNNAFGAIIHGANCQCTMNSGVAKQIRYRLHPAYLADLKTIKGDWDKLGGYSFAIVDGIYVINAYTQFYYGYNGQKYVSYDAVDSAFRKIKEDFGHLSLAYPKIGSMRGGGDWDILNTIICKALEGCDHTLVIYDKE